MRALVLSGGGLFGAWQAGAWSAVAGQFQPDLIVGASVGSLNGYVLACGASPEKLQGLWSSGRYADFSQLSVSIRELTKHPPQTDFAVVITDILRMKPVTVRGPEVTWRHLAASCAIPLFLPPVRIQGRLFADGGLLNPLPVWAAVELGATEVVALHALPEVPSTLLKPFVHAFRGLFGVNPATPSGVSVRMILPSRRLGSMRDAVKWKSDNIARWLDLGYRDAGG